MSLLQHSPIPSPPPAMPGTGGQAVLLPVKEKRCSKIIDSQKDPAYSAESLFLDLIVFLLGEYSLFFIFHLSTYCPIPL